MVVAIITVKCWN